MITTAEEYQKYLWQLQDKNKPVSAILLPSDENIYEIDLNSRIINAPEFLSVKKDHAAETIYFLVDRFYDNMDLANTACVVQYINAAGEERFFPVPFYDITTFSNGVSDQFIRVVFEEKDYKINTYYVQDDEYNFILTSEEYNPNKEYYVKNTPNLYNKYVKVNLTKEKYTPNSFYYIETDKENVNFGKYCQATDNDFDAKQHYFAKIDRRFMQVKVDSLSYKKNYYYFINSKGNMEISTSGYNKSEAYFIFIDSQKMLFPWIISGDVTDTDGIVEFSVMFYEIIPEQGEQIGVDNENRPIYSYNYPYLYSLNTQPAKSRVLYGMDNILNKESEKFDQSILAGIYSELARLNNNYTLYWIEAISPADSI